MNYNQECNLLRTMIEDYQREINTDPKGKLWLIAEMKDLELELLSLESAGEIMTPKLEQIAEKFLTERRAHG